MGPGSRVGIWGGRKRKILLPDFSGAIGEFNHNVSNVTRPNTPTNERISQVNDLSGNARHVTQTADANRYDWVDDAPDYASIVTGGALKRMLRTGMGSVFSHWEWTIAVVASLEAVTTVGNTLAISTCQNASTGRGGYVLGYFSNTGTRLITSIRESDAVSRAYTFGVPTVGVRERWIVRVAGTANGGDAVVTAMVNGVVVAGSGSMWSNNVSASALFQLGTASIAGSEKIWYDKRWNRALSDVSMAALDSQLAALYP